MAVLKKIIVLFIIGTLTLSVLTISNKPLVERASITPHEVKDAVDNYSYINRQLFEIPGLTEIVLNLEDLESISKASTHLIPYLKTQVQFVSNNLILFASLDLNNIINNAYINARCILKNTSQSIVDHCYLGKIYIPSFLFEFFVNGFLIVFQQPNLQDLFEQFLYQSNITNNKLSFFILKNKNLKQEIKDDAKKIIGNFNFLNISKRSEIEHEIIADYLYEFILDPSLQGSGSVSLAIVFNRAFTLARKRSQNSNSVDENLHALFAVAVCFANPNFIEILHERELAGVSKIKNLLEVNKFKLASINGRHDLTLHFLYSALIEQLTNDKLAFNTGELKELYDAHENAKYFDFMDITADIAGASFSKFIASNHKNAEQSQYMLANSTVEHLFFPNTSNYPKNIKIFVEKNKEFSTDNEDYELALDKISKDIRQLRLYQD